MADTGGHSHQGHHHTTQAPDHHTPDPGLSNGIHQGHHHGVHDALGGHGGHSSHTTHDDMMMMYFHGGYNEVILFEFWKISTIGGLIGSMVACFFMGILYEGLKFLREFLINHELKKSSYSNVSPMQVDITDDTVNMAADNDTVTGSTQHIHNSDQSGQSTPTHRRTSQIKVIQTSILSRAHLIQTFLQFIQVWLSYFLMLIFMTYNTWLCLSVSLGAAAGYFLFGWKKTAVMDLGGEHCH